MIEEVIKKDIDFVDDSYKDLLKKVTSKEEYSLIMLVYLKSKYPFTNVVTDFDAIDHRLQMQISRYYNLVCSVKINNDSFKIYPFEASNQQKAFYYENVLKSIIDYHINSNIPYEEVFEIYIDSYKNEIIKIQDDLKSKKIIPYYGLPSFMLKKAGFILKCASKLTSDIPVDIYNEMTSFLEKYPPYEETYKEIFPYYSENFKNEYSKFEENYLKILEFERRLEPYAKQKWTEFLTNPINHDSSHYAYLAHTFTGGEVDPSKMHKVCTSLLTENIQTIGEFGLLFGADNNFDECCCEDAGSWEISKDEYIDRDLLKNWQYPSTEDNTLFYEFENVSKILLPQDIESSVLEGGIVTYSEIVLTGNVHPIGVFYTDKCKDIEKAKQYAEKYNLELIHITPNLDKVYIK